MHDLKVIYDKAKEYLQIHTKAYVVYDENTRLYPNPLQMSKTCKQLVSGYPINKTKHVLAAYKLNTFITFLSYLERIL